jgi:hypothetical protein
VHGSPSEAAFLPDVASKEAAALGTGVLQVGMIPVYVLAVTARLTPLAFGASPTFADSDGLVLS